MFTKMKAWASNLKKQIVILYLAYKDKRVPWYAKAITACVVAYAFSPIDFIPDFIPILGYIDDVILLPLGIMLAMKLIPKDVLSDCAGRAEEIMKHGKPKNWIVGSTIVMMWSLIIFWLLVMTYRLLFNV
ncbi:DUF1232 domain-containing protein [Bacillus sp. BGMRC 2118]|nr:DUF1232 domain-containing protein [Bacillus sp. BGMRC 2118]